MANIAENQNEAEHCEHTTAHRFPPSWTINEAKKPLTGMILIVFVGLFGAYALGFYDGVKECEWMQGHSFVTPHVISNIRSHGRSMPMDDGARSLLQHEDARAQVTAAPLQDSDVV